MIKKFQNPNLKSEIDFGKNLKKFSYNIPEKLLFFDFTNIYTVNIKIIENLTYLFDMLKI